MYLRETTIPGRNLGSHNHKRVIIPIDSNDQSPAGCGKVFSSIVCCMQAKKLQRALYQGRSDNEYYNFLDSKQHPPVLLEI